MDMIGSEIMTSCDSSRDTQFVTFQASKRHICLSSIQGLDTGHTWPFRLFLVSLLEHRRLRDDFVLTLCKVEAMSQFVW